MFPLRPCAIGDRTNLSSAERPDFVPAGYDEYAERGRTFA